MSTALAGGMAAAHEPAWRRSCAGIIHPSLHIPHSKRPTDTTRPRRVRNAQHVRFCTSSVMLMRRPSPSARRPCGSGVCLAAVMRRSRRTAWRGLLAYVQPAQREKSCCSRGKADAVRCGQRGAASASLSIRGPVGREGRHTQRCSTRTGAALLPLSLSLSLLCESAPTPCLASWHPSIPPSLPPFAGRCRVP